jgi:hypothetical protein
MSEQKEFNFRKSRFNTTPFSIDKERAVNWNAIPTTVGYLPETNNHVEITQDNKLIIQLHDKEHRGYYIDDILGLGNRILNTLAFDPYRADAMVCIETALISLDNRAVQKHGYSGDKEEREYNPKTEIQTPTLEEWIAIYHRIYKQ